MISSKEAERMIKNMWNELKKQPRYKFFSHNWKEKFTRSSGIYVVWDKGKPVYFGETGNLRGRIQDLEDSRHHTLVRMVGEEKFKNVKGFQKATSKKKFPKHIEKAVRVYLKINFKISFLKIYFGRKEFEEKMIEKFKGYNKRKKRK